MKPTKKIIVALITFIAIFANKSIGQVGLKSTYIFTADSVAGFDETAASSAALASGCYGKEFKVFLYNQKRNYIKQKYNLKTKTAKQQKLFFDPALLKSSSLPPGGACNNEDFELATTQILAPGAVQGWTLQSGSYDGGCIPPSFFGAGIYTVHANPIVDPRIPGQISSYFDSQLNTAPGGNSFLQLNDGTAGAKASQASKAFIVNPNNALFQYAYLPVIEDGTHDCCDQPGFSIKVTVTNTVTNTSTVLACPNISVAVPGAGCSFTVPPGGPNFVPCTAGYPAWVYSNWTASAIDLSPYLNNLVQIDVTVVDCGFGGHGAYIYFDAKCAPMTIIGNNNQFPAGTASITLPTCGSTGATIVAPPGLGPYSWSPANPPFNTPSMSNQTFTTTNSGTYTLTMNPPGSCAPIIRVITVTITPAPQIFASVQQAPCGGTIAIASCTTAGSASVASTIVWSPNPLSINSTSTQATYPIATGVVTVTASDPLGCMASTTVNINGAPPIPTFSLTNVTGSGSITCTHPCINYIATTNYTFGALTYTWISNSGTATGTNVSFCNPAQYTVTATDPATGCSTFSVFSIGINTVVPSLTVSPGAQNITCPVGAPATFTAVTTNTMTNSTFSWIPTSGSPVVSSGTLSIYNILFTGPIVCILIDNINGCSSAQTVTVISSASFPTVSIVSPSQFTIGCGTTSLTSINITSVVTNPIGAGVTFTVLPPSFVGPTYTLTGSPTFTANAPGLYTVIAHQISNNCETHIPVSIIQNTFAPQITASAVTPTLTCKNPCTVLNGSSTNTNVSYSWAFAGPPAGQQPNDTLTVCASALSTNTITGTYTLSITDNINKCKSTQTLTIYQNMFKPTAIITGPNAITCATPTVNLINGSTTNIPSNFFPPGNPTAVMWSGPSPQPTTYSVSNYIAFTPAGVGNSYTMVTVDQSNGCSAVATKTIADNRIYPNVNNPTAPAPFILDCGTPGTNCTMIAPIISGTTTGFTYSWNPVPTTVFSCYTCSTTCVNKIGEYKITVTNPANGCVSEGRVEVINGQLNGDFSPSTVSGFAPLTVNFANLSSSSSNTTPTASITSAWSFGNGTSSVTPNVGISPNATFNSAGTYTVTMIVTKGTCLDTVQKIITVELPSVLEVPNVFTPNGDGSNDTFFLKVQNVTEIHVYIFDRWGNQVYETISNTGNITWDGKSANGKDMPAGTYFYTLKASGKDGTEYDKKGNVSIYR